jgi:hypothetical protein
LAGSCRRRVRSHGRDAASKGKDHINVLTNVRSSLHVPTTTNILSVADLERLNIFISALRALLERFTNTMA